MAFFLNGAIFLSCSMDFGADYEVWMRRANRMMALPRKTTDASQIQFHAVVVVE